MDRLTIRLLAIAVALTAVGASLVAQAAPETQGGFLGVRIAPAFGVPVGNDPVEIIDGGGSPVPVDLYGPGGQVGIALHLNAAGIIQPTINGRFNLIPVGVDSVDGVELGVAAGGAGALFNLPLGPRFRLLAFGEGGYFLGSVEGNSGSNPYYAGGGGLGFRFARSLQLNLEANYAQYFDLYSGLGVGISLLVGGGGAPTTRTPRERAPLPDQPTPLEQSPGGPVLDGSTIGLRVSRVELTDIFPVLFRYYSETPIGTAVITNETTAEVRDITVAFNVPEFMAAPQVCAEVASLVPGEQREVEIFALFTDSVLDLTEGSTVTATLTYDFFLGGGHYQTADALSLEFKNRNAITWDDDRKAAVFVTAQDEDVLRFSRNVAALIRGSAVAALPREFQLGLAMHAAVSAHGMSYVLDPTTPYQELSSNSGAVDLLQFPRQSLQFKAGDCDDLSILYASLMQAVGVDTAFVTIPGHIYVAFRLGISAEEARSTFLRSGDLIYRDDGTVWLPLEITLIDDGFMEAWAVGARQYREHYPDNSVGFFPISDAWTVYQPVTFRSNLHVTVPDRDQILPAFQEQLQRFVSREIYQQEQTLLARIRDSGSPRYINRLGILYARYGLTQRALEQFDVILQSSDYGPALLNVGNIHYLDGHLDQAVGYYERAATASPDNGAVLLAVARINFELENYGTVNRYYDRLVSVDPDMAARFSYLSSNADISTRASDAAAMRGLVVWADEEEDDE
jgi:tetratricopeptide (TPR) repeat protein